MKWGRVEITFAAWEEDVEDIMFLFQESPMRSFEDAASFEVRPSEPTEQWFESTHAFLWGLRRLFWLELIPRGRIRVRFSHSGELGQGLAPQTLLRSRSQTSIDSDMLLWPEDDSLVVTPGWFPRSDQLYMHLDKDAVFGWKGVSMHNILYRDLDRDFYEQSFDSIDVIEIDEGNSRNDWLSLDRYLQSKILTQLTQIQDSQLKAFGEVPLEVTDLLALIATHPETLFPLSDFTIFDNLPALMSLES